MTPFWQYPITQAHGVGGEQGVDFGTPFHTPLGNPLPGTVTNVDCSTGWACEIDVSTEYGGQSATEGFLHVDQPAVHVGQYVGAGELIGLSGGQLQGGSHPDVYPYSTGPHTEYDVWLGNQPWSNPVDPTPFLASLGTGGNVQPDGTVPLLSPGPGLPNNAPGSTPHPSPGPGISLPSLDIWGGFQSAITGTVDSAKGWVSSTAAPWATRNVIALVVAAVVILIVFGTGSDESKPSAQLVPVPV